tara:strand:+ start:1829 stop:2389 length:561 start_codon:yes stop_codon:yes gene_type:complete
MPQSVSTGIVVEIKKDMEFTNAAGKTYKGVRFTYSDDKTGDIKAQKFHENVMKYSPDVAKGINTLVKDDEFTMVKEKKDGSDFWNAISINKGRDTGVVNNAVVPQVAGKAAAKPFVSTYETPIERAIRQRLIVAQSSLSTAIGCLSEKDKLNEKKVFATAENIFQWVMNHKEETKVDDEVEMGEMT